VAASLLTCRSFPGKLINLPSQEVERRFDKTILGFTSALARDPDDHHRDKDHDDHFHDRNPSTTPLLGKTKG